MPIRSVSRRLAMLVLLAAALALSCFVAVAFAGPSSPTLSLAELQARLDANGGTLTGCMRTVMKGSTISTIPVEVEAITYGPGMSNYDTSSLILFQASGPAIDAAGGIAAGMSGSPVYVDDGGVYKLVGAVAYGDYFTKGGTGLATPIDSMTALQHDYAPGAGAVAPLSRPVSIDGAVKTRIRVERGGVEPKATPSDTLLVRPLSAIYVGGIDPRSDMYQAIAKRLSVGGMQVVPAAATMGSLESTYDAAFAPGSALAVLASRGDFWVGGVGTVTYTDGGTVVGMGHPMFWSGPTSLFMTNAWIDGIWPSLYDPYKLARPAALRGTITQDRFAGLLGVDGTKPRSVPITSRATNLANGITAVSTSELTALMADQPNSVASGYYGIASAATYVPGGRVFDQIRAKGSATTTTTVRVSDETTTYDIVRTNLYSNGTDIRMAVIQDVDDIVGRLQALNGTETPRAHLLSVDLATTFSPERKEARFVDATIKSGSLHTGDNTVTVSFLVNADPTTRTVDLALRIPAGVPLYGQLVVQPAAGPSYYGWYGPYPPTQGPASQSVAGVVEGIRTKPDNSMLKVSFSTYAWNYLTMPAPLFRNVESSPTSTGFVFSGSLRKTAPRVEPRVSPTAVNYGGRATIYGYCDISSGTMAISARGMRTTSVPITRGSFLFKTPALKKTTYFTLSPVAQAGIISNAYTVRVVVRPPIRPESARWSNDILYGSRSRSSARLTAKLPVSKAYAVLTIAAPGGAVTVFKGTTASASHPTTFPAWNGLGRSGGRLPTGSYRWTLTLTKRGYTTTTTKGSIHVSRG